MTRASAHITGVKGQARHDGFLTVAAEMFTGRGYELTTIADIAEAAGVTKSSLYYYFRSKEELLFQVLLRNHETLHAYVTGIDYRDLAGLDGVKSFVVRHIEFVLEHRQASALFGDAGHVIRPVDDWWTAMVDARRQHEHFLVNLVRDAQRDGAAAADLDATLSARALLAMANATHRWLGGTRTSPRRVIEHHAELAIRALR